MQGNRERDYTILLWALHTFSHKRGYPFERFQVPGLTTK